MLNRLTPLYFKIYYKEENYLKVRTTVFKYITPPYYKDDVLYINTRWTSIRFEELIAIYGCCGDSRGLLKSNTNAAVVESI